MKFLSLPAYVRTVRFDTSTRDHRIRFVVTPGLLISYGDLPSLTAPEVTP
jgi:hypothetical protein